MNILHVVEDLTVGGATRVVENLSLLGMQRGIPAMVMGFRGSAEYIGYLRDQGIECLLIESQMDRLAYLRGLDGAGTGIVLHRGGGRSQVWDELIGALVQGGDARLIEVNIFGYVDTGPASKHIQRICFNSMHTLWRAWHASGEPPITEFLNKYRVLYNPVTLDPSPAEVLDRRRTARQSYGVPQDAFVIGDVCRPAPEKLDAMLLGVSRALLRRIPNLWLITRSFPKGMANALARRLGDRYINLPLTNDSQAVADTLCAMDVFIHMSTMGESFGMATAEAMRCGIPVICNETPGPKCNNAQRELICDGVSGFFANDPLTLVRRVCALSASPELIRKTGQAARRQFRAGALAPDHIISDLLSELFISDSSIRVGQAPDKDDLTNYLRTYDGKFVVPQEAGIFLSFLGLSVILKRLYWRLHRRCVNQ